MVSSASGSSFPPPDRYDSGGVLPPSTDRAGQDLRRIAGWVALVIALAIAIGAGLAFIASLVAEDGTPALSLREGDCVRLELPSRSPDLRRVPVVDCDEPHTAEVFHVGQLDPGGELAYPPDDDTLFRVVVRGCVQSPGEGRPSPFESYIGVPFGSSELDVLPIAPDEEAWGPTGGRFICLVVPSIDGGERIGSLRDSRR